MTEQVEEFTTDHVRWGIETACDVIVEFWELAGDPGRKRGMQIVPVNGSSESPSRPPMAIDTLSLREEVRACLVSWVLLVLEERDLRGAHDGTNSVALAQWLKGEAMWLADQQFGVDAALELGEWARKLRGTAVPPEREAVVHVTDTPDGRRLVRSEDAGPDALIHDADTAESGTAFDWYRTQHPELDISVTIAELAQREAVTEERIRDRLRNAKLSRLNPGEKIAQYWLADYCWHQERKRRGLKGA